MSKKDQLTTKDNLFHNLYSPESISLFKIVAALLFILASVASGIIAILETEIYFAKQFTLTFLILELISGIILVGDYVLRVWTSNLNPLYGDEEKRQLKYIISFFGLIDLASAISFIIFLISIFQSEFIILARILRLIAFLKLIRYSSSFEMIYSVLMRKKEELLMTLMLSLLLMFFGAILMYIAEHEAQPEVFTNLFSSMWFTAVNLFTIGYGEIVPHTLMGKIVSGVVSILGITLFLLPASVIGSGFIDEIEERNPQYDICPKCNKKMHKNAFLTDLFEKKRGRPSKIITMALEAEISKEPIAMTPQRKIHNLIQFMFPKSLGQIIVFFFFMTFIVFNVLAIMVETNPVLSQETRPILTMVYIISLIIFSIDYVLRVWSCVASENEEYQDPLRGRLRYMASPLAIADLIFIIALYLMLIPIEFIPVGRAFFLFLMLFVVFKIGHFLDVFNVAGLIFKNTKKEFLGAIFICMMFLIFTSTAIFYVEHDAQPDKFSSIPATLWFGIVTFTTTGFGDMYPVTTTGRMLTVAFAFLGVALFTLPAGILGSSFFSGMQEYRLHKICPKCGFVLSRPKLSKKKIFPE